MRVYGVIGDPISHSLSPKIHAYFAAQHNIEMAYVPFHVKGENIRTALHGAHALDIRGINVTVPHKKAVMPFLVGLDHMAECVDAVNTLIWKENGYVGYNTDYLGILQTLSSFDVSFEGASVGVFGAGGSAYAACIAAASQKAAQITIINRTMANSTILASHVNKYYNISVTVPEKAESAELFANFAKMDILIQTSTVGFGDLAGLSPVDCPSLFDGVQMAFDLIYSPWETAFLRQAKEADVPHVVNGFPMLVYQAAEAFSLWHEVKHENLPESIKILSKQLGVYPN